VILTALVFASVVLYSHKFGLVVIYLSVISDIQ